LTGSAIHLYTNDIDAQSDDGAAPLKSRVARLR
jgi:hypothetical protein